MKDGLSPRAQQILKLLIARYIHDGNPVSSRSLAEEPAMGVSSATIRNILAELEENGYLASPHTSAGRVPTVSGYRFFVNHLLSIRSQPEDLLQELRQQFDPDLAMPILIQSASEILSGLTHMIGVVSLPRRNKVELRQVEFLPLSNNRVLVILVLNSKEVQNRIITTEKTYTAQELQQAANYINYHYTGQDLLQIRKKVVDALDQDKLKLYDLLEATMDVMEKSSAVATQKCIIAGQDHLLNATTETNIQQVRALFKMFVEKQEILQLLDHALDAEGVQIFIGCESGYQVFDDYSIVTASYAVNNQLWGSLGVIGPSRMPYDRVINAVDITAKLLSAALNHS